MAADILSYLSGADAPAAEQGKALAAALRKRRGLGTLDMMSGDPTLSKLGEQELGSSDTQEGQLQQAGATRLSTALQKTTQEREAKALEAEIANRGANLNLENRKLAQSEKHQTADEDLRRKQIELETSKFGLLPPDVSMKLGDIDAALKATDEAEKQYSEDPKGYLSSTKAHAAAIAHGIGDRGTPGIIEEAHGMLPGAASMLVPGLAKSKFDSTRALIAGRKKEMVEQLRAQGKNVPGPATPAPSGGSSGSAPAPLQNSLGGAPQPQANGRTPEEEKRFQELTRKRALKAGVATK